MNVNVVIYTEISCNDPSRPKLSNVKFIKTVSSSSCIKTSIKLC